MHSQKSNPDDFFPKFGPMQLNRPKSGHGRVLVLSANRARVALRTPLTLTVREPAEVALSTPHPKRGRKRRKRASD